MINKCVLSQRYEASKECDGNRNEGKMEDCVMKEQKNHSPVYKLSSLDNQESGDQEIWRFQEKRQI